MSASRVGVTAGLCDLITGMTSGAGCATFGPNLPIELEKLYVYSLIWSVGGLLEFEDRSVMDRRVRHVGNLRFRDLDRGDLDACPTLSYWGSSPEKRVILPRRD